MSPESPNYIHVPKPNQVPTAPEKIIKGVLPVPKNLFPPGQEHKTTIEWIENTTPQRLGRTKPHGPEAERLAWKQRMAESRRRNLSEGIKELVIRQKKVHDAMEHKGAIRRKHHERQASKLVRPDEALTTPSLSNSVRTVLANKNAKIGAKYTDSRPHRRREEYKVADRRDQLHTLYIHARNFITTEEALDAALEKTFGTDDAPVKWNRMGVSVWALEEGPATVQSMLSPAKRTNIHAKEDATTVLQQRMKEIAETLTGGKIG